VSASVSKPTQSQAIANLFDVMPSQIQHDLTDLDNKPYFLEPGSDKEERNMHLFGSRQRPVIRFLLLDSISMHLTVNRIGNPSMKETS